MATVRTDDGAEIDLSKAPRTQNDLVRFLLNSRLVLEEPDEMDGTIPQDRLAAELRQCVRRDFELAGDPVLEFRLLGTIGDSCYWIYSCTPLPDHPLFVYMVRHGAIAEIKYSEISLAYRDGDGTLHDRLLSAEQLAVMDYILSNRREEGWP
ncbi:MAG: hypothetical protein RLY93_16915 [Sumerlaeia bacterium]